MLCRDIISIYCFIYGYLRFIHSFKNKFILVTEIFLCDFKIFFIENVVKLQNIKNSYAYIRGTVSLQEV